MTDIYQPVVELLNRIRNNIFDRLLQGRLHYRTDMAALEKHLLIARELQNNLLEGLTLNVMGIVQQTVGRFGHAHELYSQAHDVFARQHHIRYMSLMKNNIGEVQRLSGSYQQALSYYISARYLIRASSLPKEEINQTIPIIDSNIGQVLVSLGEYDEAEEHFQDVLAVIGEDTWAHVQVVSEAWRGLAEVYLSRGSLAKAQRHIDYARELAEGRNNKLMLAESALTCAHIAAIDPRAAKAPQTYYDECHRLLQDQEVAGIYARILLNEARYQQQRGNEGQAQHFAQEAFLRFQQENMLEEARMAQSLIDPSLADEASAS